MKRFLGILSLLFIAVASLFSEMSPDAYQWMQNNATEMLIIEVKDVHTPLISLSRSKSVKVRAEVMRVKYSETSLAEGDEITITYSSYTPGPGWVGPRPMPILSEGNQCPAFLTYDEQSASYIPAAGGYSFEFLSLEGMF